MAIGYAWQIVMIVVWKNGCIWHDVENTQGIFYDIRTIPICFYPITSMAKYKNAKI